MLSTRSSYLFAQRYFLSNLSNRFFRNDYFYASCASSRFSSISSSSTALNPQIDSRSSWLKNDHPIQQSTLDRYSSFSSLRHVNRRPFYGLLFNNVELFTTQRNGISSLLNGNLRNLRTATWRTSAALELSSSPHRNQTRAFADIDRSGKNKEDAEKSGEIGTENPSKSSTTNVNEEDDAKLTLAQRFKKMWKQYWYVLLPVHAATCCAWFGLFYALSASGLDVIGIMEKLHIPEKLLEHLRNAPQAGHFVVALALYKIVTPLRYMTTLGVTYYAIKYLSRLGYIKPMPSRKQIKAMIAHKRDQFRQNRHRIQQEKLKKRHPPTSPSNGHHHHPHPHSHNHPKKPHE